MALKLAKEKGVMSITDFHTNLNALAQIPAQVALALEADAAILEIARIYKEATNCLYLGRGFNFPVALEGALKLKEISLYSCRRLSGCRNETWTYCSYR